VTSRYATESDWDERGSSYTKPTDIDRLLDRASELIDFVTRGRAELIYTSAADLFDTASAVARAQKALLDATVDQVEFWQETGEAHDVLGLRGTLIAGRVQVQHLPGQLGQRTQQNLMYGGILFSGVGVI